VSGRRPRAGSAYDKEGRGLTGSLRGQAFRRDSYFGACGRRSTTGWWVEQRMARGWWVVAVGDGRCAESGDGPGA
jgi:hypothetical protein